MIIYVFASTSISLSFMTRVHDFIKWLFSLKNTESFISKGNPQDVLQLIEILSKDEVELKTSKIKRSISENIENFLPSILKSQLSL